MATFSATDLLSRARHIGEFGEANAIKFKVTPTAGAANDVYRFGIIPAGFEVHSVVLANDDLDSSGSPTIAFKMGYTPVSSAEGSLTANDAYFVAAGDTSLQAANGGKVYSRFDPIKFEQDVFLDITLSAGAATFATGSVWVTVIGRNVGVK